MKEKTTVLIVDDSATARLAIKKAIEVDPTVQVVAETTTGKKTLQFIRKNKPDIVIMDVYLEEENGIDITKEIMISNPLPILIITAIDPTNPQLIYKALEAGALDVVPKLPAMTHSTYERERSKFIRLLKSLAKVPVVHRHRQDKRKSINEIPRLSVPTIAIDKETQKKRSIIVIGASTGGPPVLNSILMSIPAPYPFPIAIVQHISTGFGRGLAKWLAETTKHDVSVVVNSRPLLPGIVYIPNDDTHLVVSSQNSISISTDQPYLYQRPSINTLFHSAARHFGEQAVGILLTGMGKDGFEGITALKKCGAMTIAQDPATCVIDSMPRSVIAQNLINKVLGPDRIAAYLISLIKSESIRTT